MSDGSEVPALRLFIALSLPEKVKTEIERAQAELLQGLRQASVRWAKREQFHLTLKFLGDVATDRVEPLAAAVRGACQNVAPLGLRAERIGFFPDQRRPRVVWVGVHDQGEKLLRLQQGLEAATRGYSAEEESDHRFEGHVTLARIKAISRPESDQLAMLATTWERRSFGAWIAGEIEIIRSQLTPNGARYSTLATIELAASS
jgi:RNA 2',3'-cyclic 3'-phosphodiesterase